MKLEKPVMWLVNLLLSALFAFGILQFIEQFSRNGWEWYSRSLKCWPILIGFVVGLLARYLFIKWKYPLLGVSVVIAEAIMVLLFPSFKFLDVVYLVIAGVLTAVMFILGLRGEEAFPGKLAVASLLVYLAACVYFFTGDYALADFQPLCWCGLFAFTLSMYSFNAASLYTGVHNAKGGETMAIPTGIRGKNMTLLTGFLIVAMIIGSFSFLHRFLDGAWHWFLYAFGVFIRFITNVSGGSEMRAAATPTPEPEPEVTANLSALVEDGDPTFITVYAIILCVICLVFVLLAFGFSREKRGGGSHRLSDWVKRLFKTKQILEYEDDVERTEDLRTLLAERRKKARNWLRKLREKPERFEDMPDDRMRLRFAYKALLKSGRVSGWLPSATPNEVGDSLETPAFRELTRAYNEARYDLDHEVSPESAEKAQTAMSHLRGRK